VEAEAVDAVEAVAGARPVAVARQVEAEAEDAVEAEAVDAVEAVAGAAAQEAEAEAVLGLRCRRRHQQPQEPSPSPLPQAPSLPARDTLRQLEKFLVEAVVELVMSAVVAKQWATRAG